jgi:hypothetical protein
MALAQDLFPDLPPPQPLTGSEPASRRALLATLRRIDGWGPRAWREALGAWRLRGCIMVLGELESSTSEDDGLVNLHLIVDRHALEAPGPCADAACDWILRRLWRDVLADTAALPADSTIEATTYRPRAAVRGTNACYFEPAPSGRRLVLRLLVRWPFAGMCCDPPRLLRFIRRLESFVSRIARPPSGYFRHLRAIEIQRALRGALPLLDLVAFIGEGSRLARSPDDRPDSRGIPLRVPRRLRCRIDLGPLGRHSGLGIRRGITAITGAAYHGKSTLLAALAAGRDDHPPGDGRELVVADASAVVIQSEEGRRIKDQDLSGFFGTLPGGDARCFSTERASGATSMAAGILQASAAGCRLLLVDEDSAAANFLAIDPGMRALIGTDADGGTTLLEALPALAHAGISTALVAGSNLRSLAHADRVVLMKHFQPLDATRRARTLLAKDRGIRRVRDLTIPVRSMRDTRDCLLGPRHFLDVRAEEPDRPRVEGHLLDLRRCGWQLDAALVRGACAAAAWCCRLAEGRKLPLVAVAERYHAFILARGPCAIEPFHTRLIALPPWQLVVAVLERLQRPRLACTSPGASRD